MRRPWLLLASCVLWACVAQVRGAREQRPFYEAPEGTKIALVGVDVPSWVSRQAPKTDDPAAQVKAAILAQFKSPYEVVDQTAAGYTIALGPDSKPLINTQYEVQAEVGRPYLYDGDGIANAQGIPPLVWRAVKAPAGFRIDPTSGKIDWTPAAVTPDDKPEEIELAVSNPKGETKLKFKVAVIPQGTKAPSEPSLPYNAAPEDQVFTGAMVGPVPATIDAPLLLTAQVLTWQEGRDTVTVPKRTAITEVVYSLWSREGKELETTRVRITGVPVQSFRKAVTFVPDRSFWMTWETADELPVSHPPMNDETQVFPMTAKASAAAFAWPYGKQRMQFSVQLDESSPALKPGIELSNKADYDGAYAAFEQAAKANPALAGAYFDMGVMRELQGRDEEAAELYNQALKAKPSEQMYRWQLEALDKRMHERRKVSDPRTPPEAPDVRIIK